MIVYASGQEERYYLNKRTTHAAEIFDFSSTQQTTIPVREISGDFLRVTRKDNVFVGIKINELFVIINLSVIDLSNMDCVDLHALI